MIRTILLFMIMLLIVASSCMKKVDPQLDLNAIKQASQSLIDGLNADDVDAIMSVLTIDHITMAPNFPELDDLGVLRKWHENRVENITHRGEFDVKEIQLMGDWAYQYWKGSPVLTPKAGGNQMIDELKGIWIWKRQSNGDWKLARSIWNSDLPAEK